jgi:hypothetical protein
MLETGQSNSHMHMDGRGLMRAKGLDGIIRIIARGALLEDAFG